VYQKLIRIYYRDMWRYRLNYIYNSALDVVFGRNKLQILFVCISLYRLLYYYYYYVVHRNVTRFKSPIYLNPVFLSVSMLGCILNYRTRSCCDKCYFVRT
jgi:hypothetical protein